MRNVEDEMEIDNLEGVTTSPGVRTPTCEDENPGVRTPILIEEEGWRFCRRMGKLEIDALALEAEIDEGIAKNIQDDEYVAPILEFLCNPQRSKYKNEFEEWRLNEGLLY